jgi:carbamoyltransferase
MTAILGISALYHDSAAALVVDGQIVAAAQEERFTRSKNDHGFPKRAIAYCLERAGLTADRLDDIAFYDKPVTKFVRLLETHVAFAPRGLGRFRMAMPVWLKEKLHLPRMIRESIGGPTSARLVFVEHHESHAASAFFPSPFEEAAILTLDGVGEWTTTALGRGAGNRIELTDELRFPHSLGLLYSAFTYYCGFRVNRDEYKLMGLAPFGRPIYERAILENLVDLKPDGSFWLDMRYFDYCQGKTMTNRRFDALFGGPPRREQEPIERRHMDLAASIQAVTEEVVLRLARTLARQTGLKHLVMAGGVALNCVANGRLSRQGPFERIWVQPAAGDAGGALGAALFVWHQLLERPRVPDPEDSQQGSFLGDEFSNRAIRSLLDGKRATYRLLADEAELLEETAQLLADEKVVGWFQGRMEFGPRALGARSILGDPRSPRMQSVLNRKIKFRESFRPFAPCVLREHAHEWFEVEPGSSSPYMLTVADVLDRRRVKPETDAAPPGDGGNGHDGAVDDLARRIREVRSSVPAITHVDYSARIQTVDRRHGRFRRLLETFHRLTGCPVLVNTSFNLSWEPIIRTPEEAYRSFMQSEMDALVLGDCLLLKSDQPLGLAIWSANGSAPRDVESPWADPVTRDPLVMTPGEARNPVTGATYPVEEGIPRLYVPDSGEVTDAEEVLRTVKQFYETTPFPNYDHFDDRRAFFKKAGERLFARLLNEQVPYGAKVLEVGCGTGQLSNFLAMARRSVLGVDLCLNSLRLANGFRSEQGLDNVAFAQMNLFRPGLKDGFFDYVITNGVLHSTHDCRQAYLRVARLVRPGGYYVVGLYNAYSRQLHYARVLLYRTTGITHRWLDPHFGRVSAEGKTEAWFQDQYLHPRETCHTLDEMLGWMEEAGIDFVNSIPKPRPGPVLSEDEDLFEPRDPGTALSRVASQIADVGNGYREGGFYIVIGRRREETAA